jgi:hypothetical protein
MGLDRTVTALGHNRTNAPQHLAQPTRMCSLFVGETVLLTWELVRIVLLSANVAARFCVWTSGIFHLYGETAAAFRGAHC